MGITNSAAFLILLLQIGFLGGMDVSTTLPSISHDASQENSSSDLSQASIDYASKHHTAKNSIPNNLNCSYMSQKLIPCGCMNARNSTCHPTACSGEKNCSKLFPNGNCGIDNVCYCQIGVHSNPNESAQEILNLDLCSKIEDEQDGFMSPEFVALKWIFLFILVGYPLLAIAYARTEKASFEDHWISERIISIFKSLKCRRKRGTRRRNTEEDFMTLTDDTDEDNTPLELLRV